MLMLRELLVAVPILIFGGVFVFESNFGENTAWVKLKVGSVAPTE
jgi:hypothetical protein